MKTQKASIIYPKRLFSLILFIIIITCTTSYINTKQNNIIKESANQTSLDTINELTTLVNNLLFAQVESHETYVASISNALNHMYLDEDKINYLEQLSLLSSDSNYGLSNMSGDLTLYGESRQYNISESNFYRKAKQGRSSVSLFMDPEDSSNLWVVFAYPVCPPYSDIPDNILCEFVDPYCLINEINLNSSQLEILITDSVGNIVAYTDSMEGNDESTLPLYKLAEQDPFILDRAKDNSSPLLYEQENYSQFIKGIHLSFNDWRLYTSITSDLITIDTNHYTILTSLYNIGYIIIVMIALALYFIPILKAYSIQKSSANKTSLLANVSHELRTPLNTIIGISELLIRTPLNDGQLQDVTFIADAGKNLLTLINDILDFSKLQSNKFDLNEDEYDIESLIYDVTTVASVRLNDKPVQFLVYVSSYVPRHIIGDLLRVRQIINNIITNAVKYTEKGHIIVTIDSERISNNKIYLIIKVSDTGIGIKKENISKLFEDFSRFDNKKNKNVEGTGLGLSIAKRFSELMDGSIDVESTYGKGSTFTIRLKQSHEEGSTLVPALPKKETRDNILILEQSSFLREFYSSCLEEINVEYTIVENNYDFTNTLNQNTFQYILADEKTIEMMQSELTDSDKVQLITLSQSHASTIHGNSSIYIPLFSLQIYIYLTGNKANTHQYTLGHSFSIIPMPEKNVLLVDDNDMNLQVATGIMEPYKMKIDTASSGRKALELVQQNDYDIIFMDHMMPGMDGEDTFKAIRNLEGESYKTVPIIVLTANASSGAREMFLDMGFQDFIAKPLEIRKLNSVLYKWLKPSEHAESIEYAPNTVQLTNEIGAQNTNQINFTEGLERIGSLPLYLKTLRNFCNALPQKRILIENSFPYDINTFVIEVHGLKGIAAMISANELANQSLELELMGKNENLDGISALLNDYLDYLIEVKQCGEQFIKEHA